MSAESDKTAFYHAFYKVFYVLHFDKHTQFKTQANKHDVETRKPHS